MFDAGRSAFADGRYQDALQRWEVAFRLSGRPAIRYNLGLAHERLGHAEEAIAAFDNYLKWDTEGARSAEVRAKIQTLRSILKAPSDTGPSPATPPPAEPAPAEVEGEAEPMPERVSDDRPFAETQVPQDASADGAAVLPWVLIGTGSALVTGSLITGAVAKGAESDLREMCQGNVCAQTLRDKRDDANTYALVTDVLWISGALAASVGIALLIFDGGGSGDTEHDTARLRLAPGGLVLEGTL